jgi:hypothetical protein
MEATDIAPLPTPQEAWEAAYVMRLVERGLSIDSARKVCDAGEHDHTEDPRDAADEELSYWDDDGDDPE